jgi:hypothetical protein
MSTRALYVFIDEYTAPKGHAVYKHHDGYPLGARDFIANARDAMILARRPFKADVWPAAFIVANYDGDPSEFRLCGVLDPEAECLPIDGLEYIYVIRPDVVTCLGLGDWPLADIENAVWPEEN